MEFGPRDHLPTYLPTYMYVCVCVYLLFFSFSFSFFFNPSFFALIPSFLPYSSFPYFLPFPFPFPFPIIFLLLLLLLLPFPHFFFYFASPSPHLLPVIPLWPAAPGITRGKGGGVAFAAFLGKGGKGELRMVCWVVRFVGSSLVSG